MQVTMKQEQITGSSASRSKSMSQHHQPAHTSGTWQSPIVNGKLSSRRAKRGECLTCGAKLFKIGLLGKKRTPITVHGQVLNGRCLVCLPVSREVRSGATGLASGVSGQTTTAAAGGTVTVAASSSRSNKRDANVPRVLSFVGGDEEGSSDMSEVTLDRHLRHFDHDPNYLDDDHTPQNLSNHSQGNSGGRRPSFLKNDNDNDSAPTLPSRARSPRRSSRTPNSSSPQCNNARHSAGLSRVSSDSGGGNIDHDHHADGSERARAAGAAAASQHAALEQTNSLAQHQQQQQPHSSNHHDHHPYHHPQQQHGHTNTRRRRASMSGDLSSSSMSPIGRSPQQRRRASIVGGMPWEGAPLPISASPSNIINSSQRRNSMNNAMPDWKDRPAPVINVVGNSSGRPHDIVFDSSVRGTRRTYTNNSGESNNNNATTTNSYANGNSNNAAISSNNNNSNNNNVSSGTKSYFKPLPEEINIHPNDSTFLPDPDPQSSSRQDEERNNLDRQDDQQQQRSQEQHPSRDHRSEESQPHRHQTDTTDGMGDPSTLLYSSDDIDDDKNMGDLDVEYVKPLQIVRAPSGLETPDANLAVDIVTGIPNLVNILNESRQSAHEIALRKLMATFWMKGDEARSAFAEAGGLAAWTSTIWQDMNDEETQLAALEMLFSLATSSPDCQYPWLAGEAVDQAIDALLIMMQTLNTNESVQVTGCRVLAALAAASGRNNEVNDGTMSGAVVTVLNAIDLHGDRSAALREWGIRALYLQCSSSRHAQNNKCTLVEATLDSGKTGPVVVANVLEMATGSMYHAELVCMLYWCLSSSAKALSHTMDKPMQTMIDLVRQYAKVRGASMLLKSTMGAIGNICITNDSLQLVDKAELVGLALDIARYHEKDDTVSTEAYSLIANIVPAISNKGYFSQGAVDIARSLLKSCTMELGVHIEALRALNSVVCDSDVVQERFWEGVKVCQVIEISRLHVDSETWQGLSCTLFANLLKGAKCTEDKFEKTILSELCLAMSRHSDSPEVQEVASTVVCQVSADRLLSPILQQGLLGQTLSAMSKFQYSTQMQVNGCLTMWNVAADETLFEIPSLMERSAGCLVHTLQNYLERSCVVEAACSAIWAFVYRSASRKQIVAKAGGIDVLTCALVMHQNEVGILEKACGVLSTLSASRQLIPGILHAQGMSSIVDAIRNNPDSEDIAEYGSLFLKNVIVADDSQAEATSDVISVIVASMRKHENNAALQRHACSFLWAVSSTSSSCKSKVLASDAVTILMGALSHKDKNVQAAARGAFNEIALSSSSTAIEAGQ